MIPGGKRKVSIAGYSSGQRMQLARLEKDKDKTSFIRGQSITSASLTPMVVLLVSMELFLSILRWMEGSLQVLFRNTHDCSDHAKRMAPLNLLLRYLPLEEK